MVLCFQRKFLLLFRSCYLICFLRIVPSCFLGIFPTFCFSRNIPPPFAFKECSCFLDISYLLSSNACMCFLGLSLVFCESAHPLLFWEFPAAFLEFCMWFPISFEKHVPPLSDYYVGFLWSPLWVLGSLQLAFKDLFLFSPAVLLRVLWGAAESYSLWDSGVPTSGQLKLQ